MSTKISIYQVFTRLFGNESTQAVEGGSIEENGSGKFNSFTETALKSIKQLGATHIWFTGIIEHAQATNYTQYGINQDNPLIIKGRAGSPYAIKDYYDVDPDLAVDVPNRMHEFEALIKRCHHCGLQVIIDFVPNHVARQYHSDQNIPGAQDFGTNDQSDKAFDPNNNFYYIPNKSFQIPEGLAPWGKNSRPDSAIAYEEYPAKATGNDCFTEAPSINDWYETVKLNYGIDYQDNNKTYFDPVPDTWHKMLHILKFWAAKNIDGFRCDMAEMVPVEFWEWAIKNLKTETPNIIFIAEVYQPEKYHDYIHKGGFDYLYDKVGLYDILRNILEGDGNASRISDAWKSLNGLDDHMLRFLENHDEQRIASKFFAKDATKAIPAMLLSAALGRGPIMTYFAQETGEEAKGISGFSGDDGRSTIFDYWQVPSHLRWYNYGLCDGALLSNFESALAAKYHEVLNFALSCPAVADGALYDLMFANYENPLMNTYKSFAWLRYTKEEQILFVCSFGLTEGKVSVRIPKHAFGEMRLVAIGDYQLESLLGSNESKIIKAESLFSKGIEISLNPWDYQVYRMQKQ